MNWGCCRGLGLPSVRLLRWIPVDSCHMRSAFYLSDTSSDTKAHIATTTTGALPRSRYHTTAGARHVASFSHLQPATPGNVIWRALTSMDYDLVALSGARLGAPEEQSASTREKDSQCAQILSPARNSPTTS